MPTSMFTRREFIKSSGHTVIAASAFCVLARGSYAAGAKAGKLYAACGIYCGCCRVYLGDDKADKGKKPAAKCPGCANKKVTSNSCAIQKCVKKNNVETCGECKKYPCDEIKKFHANGKPYKTYAAHSLDVIKEKGLAKWVDEQEARWKCPKCGKPVAWDDKACKKCGAPLKNVEDEVAALSANKS